MISALPAFALAQTRPIVPTLMKRLRPFLTALLGLMLWVQGLAMAAAPFASAEAAASVMEMPCHGTADGSAFDCCDSDCPDMAGCVSVPLAGIPVAAQFALPTPQPLAAACGWSVQTAVPPFPLRPPIVSRA